MHPPVLRVGCPIWANRAWLGNLFHEKTKALLSAYASVFDTVEGNSTFYALPSEPTIARWAEQTPETFRFCFKIPRGVSHDTMLEGNRAELERFFDRLAPLGPRLGPFMVQLSNGFGPDRLDVLDRFLADLPPHYRFVVEVRHLAFFGAAESDLDALLTARNVGRCHFDTTALFAAKKKDPTTLHTQSRKPRVPARTSVIAEQPFLRFVGQNDVRATSGWLDQWADTVAEWLRAGLEPYVFMHAPDDLYAPRLARTFHYLVRRCIPELPEHPPWPGEQHEGQLGLL